ncbi:4-hydroxy-tetrahydrodipicolinate synthase [Oscillatoria sp. CS-180]|uniref:4-hydroxy-tetrahydrodipicolinate synthase n=1 Tax=Oscillatoria sp. CS-180 TaxID=3021720 RepID=UPI00232E5044|nr:4-hydroxy-tetrahydrodipicolinate synthase [Oscillatoria sp. CS-180]MDB9524451.1 4-hydroxy-tetrahydrodipicolinate synthase [Oscillatoria sp. CS-180]
MGYFGQVITAMVTPFGEDGSVNYAIAEALAAHLVENGSDGLVICGTTGESPTLSWDEELQLFKSVKAAVGDRAKVIAGTGSNSTREAIEATRKASTLDLDGTLQVVPYYNKPTQEGLYHHFRAIAEACPDFPVMLYNVPGRTSCGLSVETVVRLSEVDNVVAIKEASGNLDYASHLRASTPDSFFLYSGDDSLTLPLLSIGGCGVVSVASHLVGNRLRGMIQAFEMGKVKSAIDDHLSLFPLFKALFLETNPVPVKAALASQGWDVGSVRSPLVPASEAVKQALEKQLKQLI